MILSTFYKNKNKIQYNKNKNIFNNILPDIHKVKQGNIKYQRKNLKTYLFKICKLAC